MIVKNEEMNVGECLETVKDFADQVVVVDTGSIDRTVEIAEKYGIGVVRSDWRGDFSYSRNISLDQATSQWVLWLDADDRVPLDEQAVEHRHLLDAGRAVAGEEGDGQGAPIREQLGESGRLLNAVSTPVEELGLELGQ